MAVAGDVMDEVVVGGVLPPEKAPCVCCIETVYGYLCQNWARIRKSDKIKTLAAII